MKISPVLFKIVVFGCSAVLLAAAVRCSRLSVSGGGTEDVNARAIAGVITGPSGLPAAGTEVRLFPSGYNPITDSLLFKTYSDTTDKNGAYRFNKLDSGSYSLQAVGIIDRTRLLIENIKVSPDSFSGVMAARLQKPGAIKIMLPDNVDPQSGYVYVPGTDIKTFVHAGGCIEIDSVPAGTISAVYYGARNTAPFGIGADIAVPPGDSAAFSSGPWAHSIKVHFNTTGSGANISGNVYGFPVLVRLTKSIFDFSQAQSGGADVRFLKSDNTFLPYEIEGWDAASGRAQIWVSVDTVFGNSVAQYITMCWGNPQAAPTSSGASVFDTAKGFVGVWHLDKGLGDATANNNSGVNYGTVDTVGIIGDSRKFRGADSIQIPGLMGSPANLSLSAWARMDSNGGSGGEVLSVGDAASFRIDDTRPGFGVEGCFHLYNNDTGFSNIPSGVSLAKTGWHSIVLTFNNTGLMQTLYIDGTRYGPTAGVGGINYSGVGVNTLIGKHGNGKNSFNFIGCIEEARVNKTALSADWITLCYMNQKPQDVFVTVGP